METERKGVLTQDQEKILDEIIKLKGIPEKLDGFVIRIVDDKGIELLMKQLHPSTKEIIYDIVDLLFEGLEEIVNYK